MTLGSDLRALCFVLYQMYILIVTKLKMNGYTFRGINSVTCITFGKASIGLRSDPLK